MPAANKPIPVNGYEPRGLLTAISQLSVYFSDDFTLGEMRPLAQQAQDEYLAREHFKEQARLDTPVEITLTFASADGKGGSVTMSLSRRKRYTVVIKAIERGAGYYSRSRVATNPDGSIKTRTLRNLTPDTPDRWRMTNGNNRWLDERMIVSVTEEVKS